MSKHFGVLTGMSAGQIPMYYGYALPGPDPYDYLRGEGCADIQHNLGLIGDYLSRHPEYLIQHLVPTNNPNSYPYGGYGTAGYGSYPSWPAVPNHTGS
jgi:hypothetical protein